MYVLYVPLSKRMLPRKKKCTDPPRSRLFFLFIYLPTQLPSFVTAQKTTRTVRLLLFVHTHSRANHLACSEAPRRTPMLLGSLDIARGNASRDTRLLDFDPSVAGVIRDEDKPLAFRHRVFRLGLGCVLVQGFHVAKLLGATARGDGRALLLPCDG